MVKLGPFIVRQTPECDYSDDRFVYAGISIQTVEGDSVIEFPIYLDNERYIKPRIEVNHFYVCTADLNFELPVFKYQEKCGANGFCFLSLDSILPGMYSHLRQSNSDFLRWVKLLSTHLGVNSSFADFEQNEGHLNPSAERLGFVLGEITSYGRTLDFSLGLKLENRSDGPERAMGVAYCQVRPKPDRTLGKIKLERVDVDLRPRIDSVLTNILLESIGDTDALLTEKGVRFLVSQFNWTKLSLMTNSEARAARINFVQAHRELWDDFTKMAEKLKGAELYSENSSISQIVKAIPNLIVAAQDLN